MYQQENLPQDDSSLVDGNQEGTSDNYDSGDNEKTEVLREQDRFLPIANVSRIMKKSIPANGKIAKDAKECAQECVSEFVSFITSEASERCKTEKRKTINGDDILFAMTTLGFDNYVEPLKVYLKKLRELTSRSEKASFDSSKNASFQDDQSNDSSSNPPDNALI